MDTVWKELDDEPLHRRINYNEVEVLFAALQKPEPTTEVIVHASSGSIAADSGVAKVTVLAGKRAQMCSMSRSGQSVPQKLHYYYTYHPADIFLKFLKVTAEELKRAIFAMDTRVFSPHILMELMKLVPTNDEIQMLQQFENDVDNMAAAERFFWQVSQIHRYGERIRALYVRGMFDEWIDDAKNMVKSWMVGCRDVRDSKKFLEMLQVSCEVRA